MSTLTSQIPADVSYIALLFTLFVVPRFLQRFGIPSGLTALAFGAIAGLGLGVPADDQVVRLLSTLGIVSLFLFAGLDVNVRELRKEARVLIEHVSIIAMALFPVGWAVFALLGMAPRSATLVALALLTPSTGFILDSLARWDLSAKERFWIRSMAIAAELVALGILFSVLQSTSLTRLGLSAAALVAMIAVLPLLFRWFASVVIPHAPKSEFGFLIMVAVICALVTRSLGVYYLVGAFVVGMSAQQFRHFLPALSSERMVGAVEAFSSLFVPFYFFHAGLELTADYFSLKAVGLGTLCLVVVIPIRLLLVGGHRSLRLREQIAQALRVGVPMLPTTVFTLVIIDLLRERFAAPPYVLGGLVVYMLVNTLLPSLVFRAPPVEFAQALGSESETASLPVTSPAPRVQTLVGPRSLEEETES